MRTAAPLGVIERFIRTLKEQCLYLHRFQSLEEARRTIREFIVRYNREWLIERLGYRTPPRREPKPRELRREDRDRRPEIPGPHLPQDRI